MFLIFFFFFLRLQCNGDVSYYQDQLHMNHIINDYIIPQLCPLKTHLALLLLSGRSRQRANRHALPPCHISPHSFPIPSGSSPC